MSDAKAPTPAPDSRREFLRRVLRTTAYVPPAVVALGMGNLASAQATPPVMMMMGGMMASDRNLKTDVAAVDGREVLERLASVPVSNWSYKADETTRHIGPMAQDFKKAFDVGSDDRFIHGVDASGVALASIQGLYALVREQKKQIAKLEKRLSDLEKRR
jgi:hypothetical protein